MSKKKRYLLRTVKIISFLLAFVLCIEFCSHFFLCHQDNNKEAIDGFYLEDKNTIDVAFIGASEIFADYSPGLAYDEYGYTSYGYATGGLPITLYKSALKEIRRTQNPQLIVVEVNGALYGKVDKLNDVGQIRKCIDNMPLNENKIEYISTYISPKDQLEYYIPIIKYHSVWSDYKKNMKWIQADFDQHFRGYNYLKGTRSNPFTFDAKNVKAINSKLRDNNEKNPLEKHSEKAMRDFLQYCKDEKIDNIIFVRYPHIITKKDNFARFKRSNTLGDIISEYGYDYYNFEKNYEDIGIDINTDFYNFDHMNFSGQEKMTKFLGRMFVEKFGVSGSDHSDKTKEEWSKCAEFYHKYVEYVNQLPEDRCATYGEDINLIKAIDME